jgi:hypothetical protein
VNYLSRIGQSLALAGLVAPPALGMLVVAPNETVTATIDAGEVVMNGKAIGTDDAPLTFRQETFVSGAGWFENTLVKGSFAPGHSPGITTGKNQAFGGTSVIQIELGGTTPGFGPGRHDQIQDSGSIYFFGGPTLSILPFSGFVPAPGDEFLVMTWETGLVGALGALVVDSYFAANGIGFIASIENPSGGGGLRLQAVSIPEASTAIAGLLLSVLLILARPWRAMRDLAAMPYRQG